MARKEVTQTQVSGQTPSWGQIFGKDIQVEKNPIYQLLNFLTFGTPEGAKKAVASPTFFGSGDTVNPLELGGQFLKETAPATIPAAETAAVYYGGAKLIKALIPYLTYGGINRLKDTIAQAEDGAWQGKDIANTLVDKLTAGNKISNVRSEVETIVNDLLTKRMPGGFSNRGTYTAGDVNQLAKNIGMGESGGYDPTAAAGMLRSASTSLVKDIAPATKFPYAAATFLNKAGQVPVIGGLLKNPWTWPVAAVAGKKIPAVVKPFLGI